MFARRSLVARALTALLLVPSAGCNKLAELLDRFGDDADDAAPVPTADEECGSPAFPCRWDAVSKEVVVRMQEVAGEALGWAKTGRSAETIAAKLEKADDVVVLGYSEDSIRYRVKGGRPAWVFLATAGSLSTIGGAISIPTRLPAAAGPWVGPAPGAPHGPVGSNEPGAKPKKKALILSPFRWQWQLAGKDDKGEWFHDDEVEMIEEFFGNVEDYRDDGVELKQNTWTGQDIDFGVSTADFASWKDYEVIHVSTHGTSCDEPTRRCATALATGEFWPENLLKVPKGVDPTVGMDSLLEEALHDELLSQGFDMGFMPISGRDEAVMEALGLRVVAEIAQPDAGQQDAKAEGDEGALMAANRNMVNFFAGPFVLVNTHFFEKTYQDALSDKIIFLSACKSGTKSDLMDALAGPATAIIGWDKVMKLSTATAGAVAFWSRMTDPGRDNDEPRGVRVAEAFEMLESMESSGVLQVGPSKSIVIEGVVTEDELTGAKLGAGGDTTTRAQEIIRLLDDKGRSRLSDGDLVSLVGAPGDGKPDKLRLHAEVIGIAEDDRPADYVIHVDVDGREAEGTFEPTENVRPGVWRGQAEVELGFDLEGPTFVLEPWVELPTGGTSRWYYEDIGAQYFVATISGGALEPAQTFSIPPEKISMQAFDDSLVLMFRDRRERNALSEDGSSLHSLIGGVHAPVDGNTDGPEFGVGTWNAGSSNGWGWSIDVWLRTRGCAENYKGCKHLMLKTVGGPLKITRYQLGKGIARPHAEGPTVVSATFEFTTRVRSMYRNDETYTVEGSFTLAR